MNTFPSALPYRLISQVVSAQRKAFAGRYSLYAAPGLLPAIWPSPHPHTHLPLFYQKSCFCSQLTQTFKYFCNQLPWVPLSLVFYYLKSCHHPVQLRTEVLPLGTSPSPRLSYFTLHLSPIAWKILQTYNQACPITTNLYVYQGCPDYHPWTCSALLVWVPWVSVLHASLALGSRVLAEQPCSCCSLTALGSCKPTASIQYLYPEDLSDSSQYLRIESIPLL